MINFKLNESVVLFIRGLPGSGKSSVVENLKTKLPENTVYLDPDDIDFDSQEYLIHLAKMKADEVDPSLFIYRYLRQLAYNGVSNKQLVVWNQPFSNLEIFNKLTKRLQDHAKEVKVGLKIIVCELEIDKELALKRVRERVNSGGHGPSQARFEQFIKDYKSFANTGYNVITLDGSSSKNASEQLLSKLQKLLVSS